jgi:hypothetical protein
MGILYKDDFSEHIFFLFILTQEPPVGQGLLIHEVSRSHTTTQRITVGRTSLDE